MADERRFQKSREGQAVSAETVATYRATMGFLVAEWLGALLMVASFTLLYALGLRPGADAGKATAWGLAIMALGTWMYLSNRRNYQRMEFPWRRRWHVTAAIFAGAGAAFWFMAGLAWVLLQFGIAAF